MMFIGLVMLFPSVALRSALGRVWAAGSIRGGNVGGRWVDGLLVEMLMGFLRRLA